MTLLEVMLAMSILTLLFGAALASVIQVTKIVDSAKSRTRAVAILNQRMEEMRALTFTQLKSRLTDTSFTAGMERHSSLTSAQEFQWSRTLETTAEDASENLLKVTVTIGWKQLGRSSTIRAYSYFSKDGVLVSDSNTATTTHS
jgi:type II secretory pathway pseudopilin PulG